MKEKKCKYPECNNKHYAKGYCKNHYKFILRNGLEPTPETIEYVNINKRQKISEKLKVIKKRTPEKQTEFEYKQKIKELKKRMYEIMKTNPPTYEEFKEIGVVVGELFIITKEFKEWKAGTKQMKL